MQELLTMRMKELDRLRVIQMVLAGTLTWTEAAEQLTLSARQIGNVVARVRREGARVNELINLLSSGCASDRNALDRESIP